jgi:hypothetical protein
MCGMKDWVPLLIAGLGILGTLAATFLAQRGEAKRADRAQQIDATRRAEERLDALARERREAIRSDYREILRFISRTRLFVLEMRARLAGLEDWSARASSDKREVEDLEARADILRRRFLDELPDVQSLVGAWGADNLIAAFDELDDYGPKIAASMSVALHFKFQGNRVRKATAEAISDLDRLVALLHKAKDLLQTEQLPA